MKCIVNWANFPNWNQYFFWSKEFLSPCYCLFYLETWKWAIKFKIWSQKPKKTWWKGDVNVSCLVWKMAGLTVQKYRKIHHPDQKNDVSMKYYILVTYQSIKGTKSKIGFFQDISGSSSTNNFTYFVSVIILLSKNPRAVKVSIWT